MDYFDEAMVEDLDHALKYGFSFKDSMVYRVIFSMRPSLKEFVRPRSKTLFNLMQRYFSHVAVL